MPRKTVSKMKARTKLKAQLKSSLSRKVERPKVKGLSKKGVRGEIAAAPARKPRISVKWHEPNPDEETPRTLTKKQIAEWEDAAELAGFFDVEIPEQSPSAKQIASRLAPRNDDAEYFADLARSGIQPFTWKDLIPVGCILLAGIILGVCAYLFGLGGER